MKNSILKLSLLSSSILLTACVTSSPTGRNQVLLFDGSEMAELGANSFAELKKQETINQDPKVNTYVQCVSKQITDVLSRPSIKQIKNLLNFANKKRPHLETEFDQLLSKIEGVNSELKKFAKKSSSTQNIKDLYQSYKRESEKLDEENDCVVCLEDLGG